MFFGSADGDRCRKTSTRGRPLAGVRRLQHHLQPHLPRGPGRAARLDALNGVRRSHDRTRVAVIPRQHVGGAEAQARVAVERPQRIHIDRAPCARDAALRVGGLQAVRRHPVHAAA